MYTNTAMATMNNAIMMFKCFRSS